MNIGALGQFSMPCIAIIEADREHEFGRKTQVSQDPAENPSANSGIIDDERAHKNLAGSKMYRVSESPEARVGLDWLEARTELPDGVQEDFKTDFDLGRHRP